ncbi:MAG: XisI protein [Saprospiraceae bacterium]|jgi:hypothetical protein|nr:XisI protein [Saprospiraceae bacterium]
MDKIAKYSKILEGFLLKRSSTKLANSPGAKSHLVIDREKLEFLLLWVGWSGSAYKHGLMFHFQILNGKVWIHENRTDIDLHEVLAGLGISESDIVAGNVAPYELENLALAI